MGDDAGDVAGTTPTRRLPLGALAHCLGAVALTATVGVGLAMLGSPALDALFHALYRPLGPRLANRVATLGWAATILFVAITPTSIVAIRRSSGTRSTARIAVLAQVVAVAVLPVGIWVSAAAPVVLAVGVGLVTVAAVAVGWRTEPRDAAALATVLGTGLVLVVLLSATALVPLAWQHYALELRPIEDAGDAEPALTGEGAARVLDGRDCSSTDPTVPCGAHVTPETARILARHGLRCPNRDGRSAPLLLAHDGERYRVTCHSI